MTRYYKATDGNVTVFRAATTDRFRWARFRTAELTRGWAPIGDISFSLARRGGDPAYWATTEITQADYTTLCVLKVRRVLADYGETTVSKSPQNSWVRNVGLPGGLL